MMILITEMITHQTYTPGSSQSILWTIWRHCVTCFCLQINWFKKQISNAVASFLSHPFSLYVSFKTLLSPENKTKITTVQNLQFYISREGVKNMSFLSNWLVWKTAEEIVDIKTNTENDWILEGTELICQGNGSYFQSGALSKLWEYGVMFKSFLGLESNSIIEFNH